MMEKHNMPAETRRMVFEIPLDPFSNYNNLFRFDWHGHELTIIVAAYGGCSPALRGVMYSFRIDGQEYRFMVMDSWHIERYGKLPYIAHHDAWLEIAPHSVGLMIYERRVATMGDLFDQLYAIAAVRGRQEDDYPEPAKRKFTTMLRELP